MAKLVLFAMFAMIILALVVWALHESNAVNVAQARAAAAQAEAQARTAEAAASVEKLEEFLSFSSPLCASVMALGAVVVGALVMAVGMSAKLGGGNDTESG